MPRSLRPTVVAIVLALWGAATAAAQELPERIEQSRHALTLGADGLEGSGADVLLSRAAAAEFTLIGEVHGNAETCRLTAALLEALAGDGYDAFVTETGPASTAILAEAAAAEGFGGIARVMRESPFGVAFLQQREEAELFARAIELGYRCWGVDQEFIGSPRLVLSHLVREAEAETDEARATLAAARDRARAGFQHFAAIGSRDRAFMATTTPEQWDELERVLPDAGDRAMIEQLRASQHIYGLYERGRYYENNVERIRLMKRNLTEHLRAAPEARIVFKLGGAHAGRGYSPFDQLDVGNHAAELAVTRGGDSLHVLVLARQSVAADGTVTERDGASSVLRYFPRAGTTSGDAADKAGDDGREAAEGKAAVYDLTTLRAILGSDAARRDHGDLRDLALRYDLLVVLPAFTASEPLIPVPGMP